jgi:hypothetical protein
MTPRAKGRRRHPRENGNETPRVEAVLRTLVSRADFRAIERGRESHAVERPHKGALGRNSVSRAVCSFIFRILF